MMAPFQNSSFTSSNKNKPSPSSSASSSKSKVKKPTSSPPPSSSQPTSPLQKPDDSVGTPQGTANSHVGFTANSTTTPSSITIDTHYHGNGNGNGNNNDANQPRYALEQFQNAPPIPHDPWSPLSISATARQENIDAALQDVEDVFPGSSS